MEENIVKKANQKRLLGDLAIEGGNFTTAQLKTQTIKDIFQVNASDAAKKSGTETVEEVSGGAGGDSEAAPGGEGKKTLGAFEAAISSVEDQMDKDVRTLIG